MMNLETYFIIVTILRCLGQVFRRSNGKLLFERDIKISLFGNSILVNVLKSNLLTVIFTKRLLTQKTTWITEVNSNTYSQPKDIFIRSNTPIYSKRIMIIIVKKCSIRTGTTTEMSIPIMLTQLVTTTTMNMKITRPIVILVMMQVIWGYCRVETNGVNSKWVIGDFIICGLICLWKWDISISCSKWSA